MSRSQLRFVFFAPIVFAVMFTYQNCTNSVNFSGIATAQSAIVGAPKVAPGVNPGTDPAASPLPSTRASPTPTPARDFGGPMCPSGSPPPLTNVISQSGPQFRQFTTAGTYSIQLPPAATTLIIKAWGAGGSGGAAYNVPTPGGSGGGGGFTQATFAVQGGEKLWIVVGEAGKILPSTLPGYFVKGGTAINPGGGGGGGFSGVYLNKLPLVVAGAGAGGGGGADGGSAGGSGGGLQGQDGEIKNGDTTNGRGGSQNAGGYVSNVITILNGKPLQGGNAPYDASGGQGGCPGGGTGGLGDGSGGGGGGFFGGSAGSTNGGTNNGGGGGSGYVDSSAVSASVMLIRGNGVQPGNPSDPLVGPASHGALGLLLPNTTNPAFNGTDGIVQLQWQ